MTERSRSRHRRPLSVLVGAVVLSLTLNFGPAPGTGVPTAEAARASTKKAKSAKQRRPAARPPARSPVRVDPEERKKNAGKRRGSSTPPPPYSGTIVRPREYQWDFGPGTVVPRTDQLKPRLPDPRYRQVRPRGYDPVPTPGHGPGTYITPIYPGTIGPTGN